jgi:protein-S-isoprenylcysteine O-methyltransferase Ste14
MPPERLVVSGLYRNTRNPMYVSLLALLIGQALLFGSVALLAYAGLAFICTHIFVLAYEEPRLRNSFGAQYDAYCAQVPRWLPRLRPWRQADAS